LFGIVILFTLKVWELKRGSKPFSLLRYKLDLIARKQGQRLKHYASFVNTKTVRLVLAYIVASISRGVSVLMSKVRETRAFKVIRGKIIPDNHNSPVSAFLRDVAEFKNAAAGEKPVMLEEELNKVSKDSTNS
jgi:hypothetical protein